MANVELSDYQPQTATSTWSLFFFLFEKNTDMIWTFGYVRTCSICDVQVEIIIYFAKTITMETLRTFGYNCSNVTRWSSVKSTTAWWIIYFRVSYTSPTDGSAASDLVNGALFVWIIIIRLICANNIVLTFSCLLCSRHCSLNKRHMISNVVSLNFARKTYRSRYYCGYYFEQ